MKATIAGRHLWKVKTSRHSESENLWITTVSPKSSAAGHAAEKFAKENVLGTIKFIEYHGTLDT